MERDIVILTMSVILVYCVELITVWTEVMDKLDVVNLANVMGEEIKLAVVLPDLVQREREFVRITQIVNLILFVVIKIVMKICLKN